MSLSNWIIASNYSLFWKSNIRSPPHRILSSLGCDIHLQYFAWRHFAFHNLAQGTLPFWNPYIFSGTPFIAGMQSALFYPFNVLYLLLPIHLAINYTVILHIFLSGVFFYFFMRTLNVERFAVFLSALVYMFAATQICRIYAGHLSTLCTMPRSFKVGLGISLVTLFSLVIGGVISRRRRSIEEEKK